VNARPSSLAFSLERVLFQQRDLADVKQVRLLWDLKRDLA